MTFFPVIIKIANVLAYFCLLSANIYSVAGPDQDESPWHENHPTYITPAIYAFYIWGIIHFLFGGFIIYQFFSSATETVTEGIHWHFVSISLWNTLWLWLWQNDHLFLSFIVILITGSQVSFVYYNVRNKFHAQGINDQLWIHAPFSLYHAWILVIVIINLFAAFTQEAEEDEKPKLITKILVFLGLFFLQSTAVSYIEYFKGDFAGSLVIAWTLFTIYLGQSDKFISWSALVFTVFTIFHSLKPLVKKYFFSSHEETAPLLG
ncbi:8708_t:CDS:2 [Ambispora gerdemannii]|uniref:8708_t:CDS:1 n=1 Tax=Ambispora gerdemannii TaxID=144530 RepID=A0A9N8Z4G1_9GLOM|nr:8708_t:CDS:2 [Ambispora gerdemannii]